MYDCCNPKHMINCENSFGMRPLYIACLHGHLHVVKILVGYGADPHLPSVTNIDTKEIESVLQLCSRWSHMQIIEYLLKEFTWSREEIQKAMLEAQEKDSPTYRALSEY